MAQYIDKSALVAEIERRIKKSRDNANIAKSNNNHSVTCVWSGHEKECHELISFIDTLEVKEVDLELNSFDATVCKICNTYLKEMDKDAIVKALEPYKDGDKVKVIIKA